MSARSAEGHRPAVSRVVIAGGGAAGWLAAAALVKQLGSLIDVTVVESDAIGTIGVGESTIPTARSFHTLIGLDERAFMAATGSTFKLGISFEDWARRGDRYFHAFGEVGKSTWMGSFHHFWLQARAQGFGGGIDDYCFELQAAMAGKFGKSEKAPLSYAYHIDASGYARMLREHAVAGGAMRREGLIDSVEKDPENGSIVALMLRSGERIAGDLFIDCTGFRALLMGQALDVGFEDWGHWLSTDRAIAAQTMIAGDPPPYTRAIAHGAGWRWRIPLQHRMGNGLVYASDQLSDDEAHARLIDAIEGPPIAEPRVIRYATGRRLKSWHKNCVALGLSSGFVEPLESTSIHLIMIGVTRLLQLFPFDGCSEPLAARFNNQARAELERIRDFIVLHYKLTERDDTEFWRRCRDMPVPESLAERIALFRESGIAYQATDELFRVDSWLQVLLGQRVEPAGHHHMGRIMGRERLGEALAGIRNDIAGKVAHLPMHKDFLQRYCPADSPG
ncbi:tryptophan halogenase family protein [Stakelama saccharophila]|uniref:Tryptophan halogenase family protein n=1 Tax=Stakelama saccharophila TaxID=3075605 RepID=A0ABZ0B9Z0_9SPHN|nr:tryptophan halogenase family protein [Stakelama sp. W311]WNO54032.1 tryptophan halogenase family protein [Stakelama sp. W311]